MNTLSYKQGKLSPSTNNPEMYNYRHFKPAYYDLAQFPGPKAGEAFIDARLFDMQGSPVHLSDYLDKPLVIETGSVSCPMYAKCVPRMNTFVQQYPDVNFLLVYVREAHPGNALKPHANLAEKLETAARIESVFKDKRTVLTDDLKGSFHLAYGGLPDMIYVINTSGKVMFRGDWNNPQKLEEVLQHIHEDKLFTEEHFEPSKPTPWVAIKALSQGGIVAIWDFIIGLPGLLRLHKKANEAYE